MAVENFLYYGDNLDVLRRHVTDETVDLVYLDPPFKSNVDYNVLFAEHGEKAAAQVRAFEDTWVWDETARRAYEEVVEQGGQVADAMRAFQTMAGGSDMLAYLAMMAPRLVELQRVLKPTGSLWLHCDPTASHYLKLLLDAVFGPKNFVNEVVWKRQTAHSDAAQGAKHFGRLQDVLLLYAKGPGYYWQQPYREYDSDYVEKFYGQTEPATGRRYTLSDITAPGGASPEKRNPHYEFLGVKRYWRFSETRMKELYEQGRIIQAKPGSVPRQKRYLDEMSGMPLGTWWDDIKPVQSQAAERLGYPTQKPIALMERIIGTSSKPGDLVLDPFCGCGTTIDAAQALGRRWIGIDITHLSISLIKHRLADRYGVEFAKTYRSVGEPTTVDDAEVLAREDPFQFQAWALGLVGARVAGSDRKGGDKGIDGRLFFHDSKSGPTRQIILSVKAGKVVPTYVDALLGVVGHENAEIGVLISFAEPTAGMRARAADAGFYESPWGKHPRLQLRTVAELLAGEGIDYPHVANVTHRRAQRARDPAPQRLELFANLAEPSDSVETDEEE